MGGVDAIDEKDLLAHAAWLRRVARALVGETGAADLVQDTYEIALASPPAEPGPVRPWLAGVLRNVAKMRARSRARRERREEAVAPSAETPSPEELVERARTHQVVARLVLELDEPLRATLLLRYHEGLSAADIARAQGVPAGTVRWRLKQAVDQIRAQLDSLHGERRQWAVLLAPIAALPAPQAGAGTTLVVGGIAVKTGIKIAAAVAVLLALVVGSRLLGWWGGGGAAAPAAKAADGERARPAAPVTPAAIAPGGALGADRAPAMRDDDPRGTLRIEGQVIDEAEQPVGGARVAIDANPPMTAVTEKDGSFVFEGLIARDYELEATAGDRYGGPVRLRLVADAEPVILRMRKGGAVEVSVTAAGTGAPIAGAEIELRSTLTWSAKTGADGVATLRGVGPVWAPLVARASGFAPHAMLVSTRGDPAHPERVAITLGRGAAIAGRVIDEAGQPVAGARVVAASASEPFPVTDPRRDGVVSGADGAFTIRAVAAGTYRIAATHAAHAPATSQPFLVDGVHPREGVELVMSDGAVVRGVVRDAGGAPVAAADVRVMVAGNVEWRAARNAFTGDDGRFTIAGLPRRAADAVAWHPKGASAITRLDLLATREHEVTLTLDVTGAIDGVVVDSAGEPIGDAQVVAIPEWSGGTADRAAWLVRGIQETVTDQGGAFHFSGVPDGAYRVRAARLATSEAALWLGDSVAAKPGDSVTIVIPAPGGVAGKVAFADGRAPAAFTVSVGPTHPTPFAGADGAFSIEAPGGTHTVVVAGPGFMQATVRDVRIDEGKVTDLGTVTVEPGRSVSGRVLAPDGSPVANAQVAAGRLLSGDGSELYIENESIAARDTRTDEDGGFVITGFGPGRITIVAGADGIGRSRSLTLPPGDASVVVDLVLEATGGIDGTITSGGQPVADTIVIANPIGATSSNFFVVTGPDGSFALDALTPGTYVVYPMLGGGGNRPKDMIVRAVTIEAGARAEVAIDASPGPVTMTIEVVTEETGAAVAMCPVIAVQADIDEANVSELRDGSWVPPEMLAGGTAAMYMRMVTFGRPVEIPGMRTGHFSACAIPLPIGDDPGAARAYADDETLPMKCIELDVAASPAAQSATIAVPVAWTQPPAK